MIFGPSPLSAQDVRDILALIRELAAAELGREVDNEESVREIAREIAQHRRGEDDSS